MHRLGFSVNEAAHISRIYHTKYLDIQGIYTHLCVSDSLAGEDVAFTNQQIKSFYGLLDILSQKGMYFPKVHIQSSYGLLNYPQLSCDYVRAGIALYGTLSGPGCQTRLHLDLRPVLSLHSRIILIRKVQKGETAGYGRAWTAPQDSRIAILPIGYADGLPRSLSCQYGEVLIRGMRVPIIGRICMDQLAVDITGLPEAAVGDTATFIGTQTENSIDAPSVAEQAGTITNELLSRLGHRLKIIEI